MTDTTTTDSATPNRRTLAKQATTAKVLVAARAMFAEAGYATATIRAIADRAEVSTGSIFSNYTDKAELYRAAYGHDPITPEVGRSALIVLRALVDVVGNPGAFPGGFDEEIEVVDVLKDPAREILEAAGFPPLAMKVEDEPLRDAVLRALSEIRP